MLYPLSAQIPFAAMFTASGAGATGLTVTVSVVRVNTDGTRTVVITQASATAATEVDATNAKGLYSYWLAGASTGTAGMYLATFHTAGTCDLKDVPALEIVGATWVGNVDTPLSTIAGYVDTEVAAIKAKTDALPSDPADASDIAALLTVIDDLLDTEIAAIKLQTDRIGGGTVTVNSPVTPLGAATIYAGYDHIEGLRLTFTEPATGSLWPAILTGADVFMTLRVGMTTVEIEGEILVATGSAKSVRFAPTKLQTAGLATTVSGRYDVYAVLTDDAEPPLLASGQLTVIQRLEA